MDFKELIQGLDQFADYVTENPTEPLKPILHAILSPAEVLMAAYRDLKCENQQLRDENNRLKGEQGQPSVRKQTQRNFSDPLPLLVRCHLKQKKLLLHLPNN